ncbi:MAG TPA: ABC transporter ATP-binding protein, partial [Burkholderiales bacterium]|nr:ABC transporter ATP-binding protein [Burkholderiales bacterium]
AQGTPREVLEASGLATWSVEGEDLYQLAAELRGLDGITQVVPFGNILHVSGSDPVLLDDAIAPYQRQPRWRWTRSQAGLEDAFIHLMDSARDNYQ